MLKLKSLRFSGIGRFVEDQTIEFDTLGNLIQVDGENRNTGGSSGSGKSTVFNALDYLFGLNDLPLTVLQSRLTKDPISVRGEFDYDGKPLLVTRNKRGLIIDLDGQVFEGSSKLTEEKLDSILGMPRDIFRKILHKRQKEGGFFLDFTPKKMYEFLTNVLDLAAERKKLEKVELKLSELEKAKITRQNNVNTLQSGLTATQEAILALGLPPVRDIHQSVILELKGKLDGSTKKFKEVEEKQKQETQELEKQRPQVSVQAFDSSDRERLSKSIAVLTSDLNARIRTESERIHGIRSSIQTLNLEQNKISYIISDSNASKIHATEYAGQIKKIRDSICPTCERPDWVTETAKVRENEFLAKIAACKEKIAAGTAATERLNVISQDLALLSDRLKPVVDPRVSEIKEEIAVIEQRLKEEKAKESEHILLQNATNSNILQHFATKQSELRKAQSMEIDQARGQFDVDRRAFDAAVSKLKAYDDAKNRYEVSLATMKSKEEEYQKSLDKAIFDQKSLEEQIVLTEELKKAVKLFISCSFDDALESISDSATKIIRCIPVMSNATIQFEGQKETQDGKIKEEVNAVISMDGEVGIPIKSLCGGERSSVDLAVDLAVIDFIESESAKGIDVFILDEPFTGLDTVSIEMALEVLKNSNSTKKLIVVDHNPEVKQMVSNRLVVVREGSTSNITQEVANG